MKKMKFIASAAINIRTIVDEKIRELIFEQEILEFAAKYRVHILKIEKRAGSD